MTSILAALWNCYIHYLWNYDSNSWVATIAYVFRIWAIFAVLPTLVLGLLDVTSYVIARTLGDPTASTSHKSSFPTQPFPNSRPEIPKTNTSTPQITVPAYDSSPQDESLPSGVSTETEPHTPARAACAGNNASSSLPTFFVDGEGSEDDGDGVARLAGVGVFSPVASMPGSPVVSRRKCVDGEGSGSGSEDASSGSDESAFSATAAAVAARRRGSPGHDREEEEGHYGHERSASDGCGGVSTSGESSFALVDREESFEDAGTHIRRRVPGTASDDE